MKILDVPQSGSVAGVTSSRNRNGQYRRSRSIPVNPASAAQGVVRGRMSVNSAAWRTLTDAQRAGWTDLGLSMTRTDSLGQSYTLTGFQAYCSVNNNLLAGAEAVLSAAPAIVTPSSLATVTITSAAGTLSIAYTATPLPANTHLAIFASPQRSPGRAFEGDFRLLAETAAAAASPYNALAAYTAKFGAPIVGQKIFFRLHTMKGGFLSGPFEASHIIVA